MSKYKTIKGESTAEYKDKGSRFMAYATEVSGETEAERYIKKIAAMHHKARHVCFAYITGVKPVLERYSDANEPSHTAGQPILNQIRKAGLVNVIIVVIRYFGGVLLGKGGLIRAYGSVAESAVQNAVIIEKDEMSLMEVEVGYNDFHLFMDSVKRFEIQIIKQEFGDICKIKFAFRLEDEAGLTAGFEKYNVKMISDTAD